MPSFESGQRWSYRTRDQDQGSTLVIGSVQKRFLKPSVIHIKVEGVFSAGSNEPTEISHMPFTAAALETSVSEQVADGIDPGEEHREGQQIWKRNRGGVFDIAVAEAVDGVLSVADTVPNDPIDRIVREMRASQDNRMIDTLYNALFSLEQWHFICDPIDPHSPASWVFPDGHNPTPAVLAFTSQDRAVSAAIDLELYPAGTEVPLMSVSTQEAVEWITGEGFNQTWLCFNLTFDNFPLYCERAEALRRQFWPDR